MTKSKNRVIAFLMLFAITFIMFFGDITTYAVDADSAMIELKVKIIEGNYMYRTGKRQINVVGNRYKKQGGGYYTYTELLAATDGSGGYTGTNNDSTNPITGRGDFIVADKFDTLKPSAKQKFLSDIFRIANAVAADTENGYMTGEDAPTDDTVADFMSELQDQAGLGSSMLATLMQNTKPDYAAANRIYEPFSGTVGTILGVISILVMALLGVTMALDIAYITIPAFQMAMNGGDTSGNGEKSKGIGGIISQEAKKAVQAADGGSGGQSGSGEYKAAVGIYFKYRWKGLVLLGICLLYLVQGQIYSFVGWFIDLFSGFLGF